MAPRRRGFIRSAAACSVRKTPVRFTAIVRCQVSSAVAPNSTSSPMPALALTISGAPVCSKARSSDARSVPSTAYPAPPGCAAAAAGSACSRSKIATRAPCASPRAVAAPMPFAPPVTTAILPEKSKPISSLYPEMGGIAGTPFCRLEDGDCISKPTQFQTNHSKPNQPIPTQPTTGWTGAAGGGPAGPGFGAEPHLKEIFHFLINPSAAHEAQAALGDSFPNLPRRRHRRLHFALPQQLDLGAPHALGKLCVAGGFRDLFQSPPTQPRPENCSAFLE